MADRFDEEFDRIAFIIDPTGHEDRRRQKTIGPILDEAVRLIKEAVGSRDDFHALDQDREGDSQLVIICHIKNTTPLAFLHLKASEESGLVMWATRAPTSPFRVSNRHYAAKADELTLDWVRRTLATIASEAQN